MSAATVAEPPQALSLTAVAHSLGVHYMTAYRYVRLGALTATQRRGHWEITPAALEAFRARRLGVPARHPRPVVGGASPDVAGLAARLMVGDQTGAWNLVEARLAAGMRIADAYRNLLIPAMRSIGDDWASGVASIADEHRATVVASRIIGRLGARCTRRGRPRGHVVMAAAPGDHHAIPSAIVADLLRLGGVRVTDLGADVPGPELAAVARDDDVAAVGICATATLEDGTAAALRDTVGLVHAEAGCSVVLGGAAIRTAGIALALGADHWSCDGDAAVDLLVALASQSHRRNPSFRSPPEAAQ